jgi:(R,R)-butanediol dehydrogenase / meso-butanediol dehydrogenase / diacetyl reductase
VRAAVFTSGQPCLTVAQAPDPTPGPGDLILRVDACGICGSDLHMAQALRDRPGIIFGHEFCGTVVAAGAQAHGYREGDRVVGLPLFGCGHCSACVSGAVEKCPKAELTGAQRPGAYAEFVAVSAAESFAVPDALSNDLGALVEPLAVAHHALERTPREPGEPVLVLGAGPVGLAVAAWALALGAREVVVSDPVAHRRALAERIGATAIDPTHQDVAEAFATVTGGPARAVLECVGRPGVIAHAMEVAATDANVTLVGACMAPDTFHPLVPTSKELTLRFVIYYRRRDFTQTLAHLSSGRLDPSPLVTGHIGLDELPARFDALLGENSDCKVLIHP